MYCDLPEMLGCFVGVWLRFAFHNNTTLPSNSKAPQTVQTGAMPSSSSSASEGGGGGSSRGKGGDGSKYRQRQLVSPAIWAVLVLGMLVTGAWFVSVRYFALPQPAAAATTPASAFSAERAMRHVQALAGDIGCVTMLPIYSVVCCVATVDVGSSCGVL